MYINALRKKKKPIIERNNYASALYYVIHITHLLKHLETGSKKKKRKGPTSIFGIWFEKMYQVWQ